MQHIPGISLISAFHCASNVLKSYQIHTELPSSEEWVIIGNVNRGAEAFKIRPSRRAELVIL